MRSRSCADPTGTELTSRGEVCHLDWPGHATEGLGIVGKSLVS